MAVDARSEVIRAYRTRREELAAAAKTDEQSGRPLMAARKRQAAKLLSRAISDEVVDDRPVGIGTFDDCEAES